MWCYGVDVTRRQDGQCWLNAPPGKDTELASAAVDLRAFSSSAIQVTRPLLKSRYVTAVRVSRGKEREPGTLVEDRVSLGAGRRARYEERSLVRSTRHPRLNLIEVSGEDVLW